MSKPGRAWVLLAILPLVLPTAPAGAQLTVETRVAENFRREPQGQILGRLEAGVPLSHVSSQASWTEVSLEGWVWTASLRTTDREGFQLVVSVGGGENVRAAPSGEILGRLEEGTLLEELDREPGWTLVRRSGWLWSPSVAVAEELAEGSEAAQSNDGFVRLGDRTPILSSPDGDTLAFSSAEGDVQVLARQGNWTRVRLDGWVWRPRATEGDAPDADDAPVGDVTPDMLTGQGGDAYVGRRVTWRILFISLERAEAVRTDFFEGEPFMLGRFGGGDGPFVYVAVPPERIDEIQGLTPLEVVTITGRVRRASSALTETPILELLAIERGAGR
ncbi:MAG: hypothetical protein WD995_03370 [Gemmatimonadota bacterium]